MIALNGGGKRFRIKGDSNAVAIIVNDKSLRWTALMSEECSGVEFNEAYSGQGWLPNGLFTFDEYSISYFNQSLDYGLWLANGTNDLPLPIENASKEIFKARLLEIIDFAHNERGWKYSKIILPTIIPRFDGNHISRIDAFNAAIEELAELRNCVLIDLHTIFMQHPNIESLYGDPVHTNELGQRLQADIYKNADYTPYNGVTEEPTLPPDPNEIKLPFKFAN
jgi:GDSL-like Lipase/Acylhydrolase family